MKGEALPTQIEELEDIFKSNRDNDKIRQMHKDVEQFEETVRKKALLDEQTRLQQLESEQLDSEVKKIQSK